MTISTPVANPKISIITIVYNNVSTIEDTIQSVLGQNYLNREYIVVDGNSSDGTLEILEQYKDKIDVLISEEDEGLYDALNKGIKAATGDVIGILHSDDLFQNENSLQLVANAFQNDPSLDCTYGDLVYVKASNVNQVLRYWKAGEIEPDSFEAGWMPPHPTFFVKKEVYSKYGLYDTSYQTAADYELMLRYLHRNKLKSGYIQHTLVRMRTGGTSNKSFKNRLQANREDLRAWKENNLQPKMYLRFFKPFRKVRQFSMSYYGYQSTVMMSLVLPFMLISMPSPEGIAAHFELLRIALALIFSWGVAAASVPAVSAIARSKGLVDNPNIRSSHYNPTPTLGGISVFVAVVLGVTIWGHLLPTNGLQYVIAALTLIFFTGLKDDVLIIDPVKKLLLQVLAALILIIGADLRIESFYGILGIFEIPYFVSLVFSTFVYIVIINAFNLIDGIDGLASGLGLSVSIIFGGWFLLTRQVDYAILAFSMAGGLIGFMKYNLSKDEKIFLGDTGSLLIGMVMAILTMRFIYIGPLIDRIYELHNAPLIAVVILGVPLFDTLRVFGSRILKKQSPFFPDKTHIHHLLIRRNPNHRRATMIIVSISTVLVVVFAKIFSVLTPNWALLVLVGSFVLYLLLCHRLANAKLSAFSGFFLRHMPFVYFFFFSRYERSAEHRSV